MTKTEHGAFSVEHEFYKNNIELYQFNFLIKPKNE